MTTAQKTTLSIVSANAAAKTAAKTATKTARKTATKTATKTAPAKWDSTLIPRIAESVSVIGKAAELKSVLDADIKKFRTYKVKIGDRRTCGIAKEFHAAFIALGVKEKTATNYLSCLRESINLGKPFSLNHSRDNAKANGEEKTKTKKPAPANAYKDVGTVLAALATAIQTVKQKAGVALWQKAMATAPDGFDFAVADFLESQGE